MTLNSTRLLTTVAEVRDPIECELSGALPDWLTGIILRNGAGKFEVGDTKYIHWFDGLSFLQKYEFVQGKVHFTGKFLKSDTYKLNMEAGTIVVPEFGTARYPNPRKGLFDRIISSVQLFCLTDNALVNFITLGDHIFAATEIYQTTYHRIDPISLESIGKRQIPAYLVNNPNCPSITAHPHYDSEGNAINICNSTFTYDVVKTPKPAQDGVETIGQMETLLRFSNHSVLHPSYFHSFGMSDHFALLFESPLTFDALRLLYGFGWIAFNDWLYWNPAQETRLLIGSLSTEHQTPSVQYFTDAMFTFHHVNTYEVENDSASFLVADYIGYDDGLVVTKLTVDNIRKGLLENVGQEFNGLLKRLVIPLSIAEDAKPGDNLLAKFPNQTKCEATLRADGSVLCKQEIMVDNIPVELPRINYERVNGKPYAYCYAASVSHKTPHGASILLKMFFEKFKMDRVCPFQIIKVDMNTKTFVSWPKSEWETPTEPLFITRPGAEDEDDGVVVAPVLTVKEGDSPFLLILDARTLQELARAKIPSEIPIGSHGVFLPARNLLPEKKYKVTVTRY